MAGPVTESDVLALWSDLIRKPGVHWPETPLQGVLGIFSDAVKAFAANATLGAAILCRTIIDGAFLIFLVYSKSDRSDNEWLISFPIGLNGNMRDVPWSELRSGVKKSELFSEAELG